MDPKEKNFPDSRLDLNASLEIAAEELNVRVKSLQVSGEEEIFLQKHGNPGDKKSTEHVLENDKVNVDAAVEKGNSNPTFDKDCKEGQHMGGARQEETKKFHTPGSIVNKGEETLGQNLELAQQDNKGSGKEQAAEESNATPNFPTSHLLTV